MTFSKGSESKDKQPAPAPAGITTVSGAGKPEAFLGKGSKVVGTLHFSGPVEVDGQIEGEINSQERLVIGESAVVNAKINGAEILVRGTVNGDITASRRLSLQKPAKVMGNMKCSVLAIEEGVVFEGKCSMDAVGGGASVQSSSAASAGQKQQSPQAPK